MLQLEFLENAENVHAVQLGRIGPLKLKINYTLVLIVTIFVIIIFSIGNRIATTLYYLKGFHLVDTNYVVNPPVQTVNGITFALAFIPKGSPYYDSILSAEFNAFLITIKNNGTGYLDYDPMDFFLENGPKKVERAFSPEEAQDTVSSGFIGSAKPIRVARKLIRMTYLPPARLFPGYERKGILLFPRFIEGPQSFVIKFAHMNLNAQPFKNILFVLNRPQKDVPLPAHAP